MMLCHTRFTEFPRLTRLKREGPKQLDLGIRITTMDKEKEHGGVMVSEHDALMYLSLAPAIKGD